MRRFLSAFKSLAVLLYRISGGFLGGRVQGLPVLLLATKGRKTGKSRTTPLGYFEHDGGFVVTASNAGSDSHPAWFLNLRSNPEARVHVKGEAFDVTAEIATPELRAILWSRLIELAPGYARYSKRTRREIPLVILKPAGPY